MERKFAETVLHLIQHSSHRQRLISCQLRMRLDVSSHTIDEMRDALTLVGIICVVVDNSRVINCAVVEGEQALVPVDMASQISINAILEHERLEGVAQILLVRRYLRAVHWAMGHGDDPGSFLAIDGGQIFLQPLPLLIGFVDFPVVICDVAEWT